MQHLNQRLAGSTKDAMQRAVLTGVIDRRAIADAIQRDVEELQQHACVQAQAAVAGLNQAYRNQIAARAELEHWFYFGTLIVTSRPFCRIHIGYVYPTHRVLQMRNGMLEPVMVFKGGFRCRHSWLPVNPAWDEDLASRIVDEEPTEVCLDVGCNRKITVVAPAGRVARLEQQIALRRVGYEHFLDAPDNETGFVALHRDWRRDWLGTRHGSRRRHELDHELEVGRAVANLGGHDVRFNPNLRTHFDGPADLAVDTRVHDVKTIEAVSANSFVNAIRRKRQKQPDGSTLYQADHFILDVGRSPDPLAEQRALALLERWLRQHPGTTAYVLNRPQNQLLRLP